MRIHPCATALLPAALVALGGCGDGIAGPEAAGLAARPSTAHGAPPRVLQRARAPGTTVHTTAGRIYGFRTAHIAFANGKAVGNATLSDPDDPSRRVHYRVRTGRADCVDGVPAVFLEGELDASDGGKPTRHAWMVVILPYIEQQPVFRDEERNLLRWEWVRSDAAGAAGESFVAEAAELYFSPDICGGR